ncbi:MULTISPECIES: hemagglutinin repeat-containing protein [Cupriavidus]
MYANKIMLASTENGVGVSLRGVAAAQAGELALTAQGKLVLAGQTSASGHLVAYARDGIDNTGTTYGARGVSANTEGVLSNSGTLAAQQWLNATGGSVSSTGTLAAGVNADGTAAGPADLTVTATRGALTATGRNQASGNATLQGSGVNLAGSQITTGGNLDMQAGMGNLDLTTATTTAGAGLVAATQGALVNDRGQMSSQGATSLTAGSVSNRGGQIISQGSTTITSTNAVDNTQGTVQATGALAAIADSLDNTAGRLVSLDGDGLSVRTTGALKNVAGTTTNGAQGGVIGGNGDVRLTTGVLTNHGQVSALGDATVDATSLDNASGTIAAGGQLDVVASGAISNRQGNLYGQSGVAITSDTLDNTGGSAQTHGDLSVEAASSLTNIDGTLAANGDHGTLSVGAASVDNTRGVIGNSGDGTTTVKATTALTNTAGRLGGNGDVTVQAQTLTNDTDGTTGALLASGGALDLAVSTDVDNRGGTLYGGKALTLEQAGATLDNTGGQILGGTDIQVDVATVNNLGGAIKANHNVAVAGAVSGSGEMAAGRNLSLDVAGDYANDTANKLRADGDMRVSATGTLTNTGALAAAGGLTVHGADVVNAAGAGMNGSTTTVTASHSLTNAGRIEGDTVQTNSPTTTNTGTIIGNNVTVQGADVVNTGDAALMAAAQNLHVYASNSVHNLDGATLYSAGNLQIARDGTRDSNTGLLINQVSTLTNRSATIDAEGDIDIAAKQVDNTRASLVTAPGTSVSSGQTLTLWQAGLTGTELNYHISITFPGWAWSGQAAQVSTPQTDALRTPVTVTVDKSTVTNLDTGKQTLSFSQSPIEQYIGYYAAPNCDVDAGVCSRPIATNPTQYYQSITDNGSTYSITFWPDWDPNKHIRPDQVRQENFGHDYNEIARTTVTTTATDQLVSASDPAKIRAGGNIRINSTGGGILNQSSIMAAGGDLVRAADAGAIQDIGTALQQTVSTTETSTFYWHQRTGGSQDWQTVAYPSMPQTPTTVMALPALASANKTVQTTAQTIDVTTVNRSGETVTGSGVSGGSAQGKPQQTLGTAQGGIPNLRLPTNGLYRYQTAPGATYLIATDPRFTQYSQFISSDYMLGQLGLDPMRTQKRLGDGFYEEKLIRDQVTQLTGRTFLAGYSDNLTEYQALMDSGVAYAKAFGLTPGIGLSADQMARLTTDMVWLVSQDVTLPDGTQQSVLVPKLYLAQSHTIDLQSSGALVTGSQVSLNATGDVTNSGKIVGDMATQVLGNNVANRGAIGGAGTTVVSAQQDVHNLGGRITGTDTLVTAGRDVINASQTITNTTTLANGNSASATGVGAVGTISATNNVGVLAGRDIDMAGGSVDASSNALLAAGRDLNLGTVATGTTQDATAHGGQDHLHNQTTVNNGSTVRAGGNMAAIAGRDMTLTNATVQSSANTTLVAGQNLTIGHATDTHSASAGAQSNQAQASFTRSSYDETVRGSNVQAGRDVTLAGGQSALASAALAANGIVAAPTAITGSVMITGSGVSAGNDGEGSSTVVIAATQDVTVGEAREVHDAASDSRTRRSGFLSRSSSHDQSSSHADLGVGSAVAGDTVAIVANNDLTIRQSTVIGTDAVSLTAKQGNVRITAGQNVRETNASHEASKSGVSAFAGQGGIGVSVGSSSGNASGHTLAVTQSDARSLVGAANGNVTIAAGKDAAIVGSDVIAGAKDGNPNAGNIDIQAQNIAVVAGVDHVSEQTSQSSRSSSLGIALVGTPFDAANNLRDAQKSPSGVTRAKQTLGEIGASAGTLPQVAITAGSSHSNSAFSSESITHDGSTLSGAGNVRLRATGDGQTDAAGKAFNGDILLSGSAVTAGGKATLDAQRHVNIEASTDTYQSSSTSNSGGWKVSTAMPSLGDIGRNLGGGPNNSGVGLFPYSGQMANASGDAASTRQNASTVTGNAATVVSRTGDIRVAGSGIGAQDDVMLSATQGRIDIVSGQETSRQRSDSSSRQIGDLGGNGYAGTVGVRTESHHLDASQTSQNTVRSQVVSQSGSVTMVARDDITAPGADIRAAQDVTLVGRNVNLDPGTDTTAVNQQDKSSQYGVTLALSGYSVQAAQAVENAARAKEEGRSDKVVALYATQAAIAGLNTYSAVTALGQGNQGNQPVGVDKTGNPGNSNAGSALIKATVSVGGGSQQSESHSQSRSTHGTTVSAGSNVKIVATGSGATGADGYSTDGDINARGAQITGQNVTMSAARDVNLQSAQDATSQNSASSGANASIGVGFGLGGQQNGFTLELAAGQNKGKANGDSVTNHNARVTASDTLTLSSGRDTNLQGAQAIGNAVVADVGRNLNIESRQDTDTYHSKQQSSGAQVSVCVPPFCVGTTVSGSASASQGNTDSTYKSVVEQSGIYAGSGGLDVNVKGNTDLKGGVIASTAEAAKNHVTTATLTTSDLENVAEYKSSTSTIAGSFDSGLALGKNLTNSAMATAMGNAVQPSSGSAAGVTKSAIAAGTVTITDNAGQQALTGKTADETVAGLNRDTASANQAIDKIFDEKKVADQQAERQLVAQTLQQAMPIVDKQIGDLLTGQPEAVKVVVHGLVGGLITAAVGGNFAMGAAGTAAGTAAIAALNDNLGSLGLDEGTRDAVLQTVGMVVAGVVAGGGANGAAAAGAAGMADAYNRQLHPQEKDLARQIAQQAVARGIRNPDGSPVTSDQIENAMRSANNSKYGETSATGALVPLNDNTKASQIYDTTGMVVVNDGAGHNSLMQDPSMLVTPSETIQNLIIQNTGGESSQYSWNGPAPDAATSNASNTPVNPFTPAPNGCITAECAAGLGQQGRGLLPDYATGGVSVLSGSASATVNLYDGTSYVAGGVTQNFPSVSWRPGVTGTLGWIFGANAANAANSFLNGDGNQAFVSIPTPFKFNVVGAVTHAYGGSTAVEIGLGSPGTIGFGVTPWSHGAPVTNGDK